MPPRNLKSSDLNVNNKETFVKGTNGKPGILLVFAAYCNYCTRFKPTFAQLHSRIGNDFNVFALEDKDMTTEIATSLEISGYPTLKFFDKSGRIVSEYTGDRSLESLLVYICKFYHTCK